MDAILTIIIKNKPVTITNKSSQWGTVIEALRNNDTKSLEAILPLIPQPKTFPAEDDLDTLDDFLDEVLRTKNYTSDGDLPDSYSELLKMLGNTSRKAYKKANSDLKTKVVPPLEQLIASIETKFKK